MRFDILVKVFKRRVVAQHSFVSRGFQLKQNNDFISNFTFLIEVAAWFVQTVYGWSNSYDKADLILSKDICNGWNSMCVSRHQMRILPPD